jgi:hypothetical protein
MTQARQVMLTFASSLIDEGVELRTKAVETKTSSFTSDWFVPIDEFAKWRTSCRLLMMQLGSFANPWNDVLAADDVRNNRRTVDAMLGALKSVSENVSHGRLARFEDIVFAEAFSNLFEQAEYLLDKGYYLAAGVLFRATLEEKLRRMCDAFGCVPQKQRPTISDYNQALYTGQHVDKLVFKGVDEMSAIGNDAAHGKSTLTVADIERLKGNLADFLRRN